MKSSSPIVGKVEMSHVIEIDIAKLIERVLLLEQQMQDLNEEQKLRSRNLQKLIDLFL